MNKKRREETKRKYVSKLELKKQINSNAKTTPPESSINDKQRK